MSVHQLPVQCNQSCLYCGLQKISLLHMSEELELTLKDQQIVEEFEAVSKDFERLDKGLNLTDVYKIKKFVIGCSHN